MKKFSHRKGNNLVEYAITALLVGVTAGYALFSISPDTFKNFFVNVFHGGTSSGGVITLRPLGDVP